MQALKALVIFMGVLIVAGVALVAYSLITRLSLDKAARRAFGEVALPLPAGCVLAEARSEGGRLILRGAGPAERGCQQVLVIDLENGEVLGRIRVVPGP